MVSFAVRTKVLEELFSDPEWARSMKDAAKVTQDFSRARGYEVRRLKE